MRDVEWRDMTRGGGTMFMSGIVVSVWGEPRSGRGSFFSGAGFGNKRDFCTSRFVGEPRSGRGNFFLGLDLEIIGFLYITVCGGTSIGLGELFSGAGFGNNWISVHNRGGTWTGPGELFFSGPSHLTLTKARTPTARRC